MPEKRARLPWIFIDGGTQEIFRIRHDAPALETDEAGGSDRAHCAFHIIGDDGGAFDFHLEISSAVLENYSVEDLQALLNLIASKGAEIVEGAIHRGIRGDQQLVWEPDGVSLVR